MVLKRGTAWSARLRRGSGTFWEFESPHGRSFPRHPDHWIVGRIKLLNLRDLAVELHLGAAPDDAEVALFAWLKWGRSCPEHLTGDFSFAAWDRRAHILFCCRDQMGSVPLFYRAGPDLVELSSHLPDLLTSSECHPRLDREKLQVCLSGDWSSLRDRTFHEGIFTLPPATWFTFDGKQQVRQKYWNLSINDSLVPTRQTDVFEALRELLTAAVAGRIRGEAIVTADLSGGLDSSTVVALAARSQLAHNGEVIATAAALPESGHNQHRDERDYIEEFRSWPNVRIEYVTAPDQGPFDILEEKDMLVVHPFRNSRTYLIRALEENARAHNTGVHLRGMGGELAVSNWSDRFYAEMAVRGHWGILSREVISLLRYSGRYAAKVLLRRASMFRPSPLGLAIAAGFGNSADSPPLLCGHRTDDRLNQLNLAANWLAGDFPNMGMPALAGLPVALPLADKQVVEFCISAPTRLKIKNGYNRYLLRRAMDGILPARIQWRRSKTAFSPDYYERFARDIGKAHRYLAAIGPGDPVREIVDVARLEGMVKTAKPAAHHADCSIAIPNTLYLIQFLRQFTEFRN